MSAITVLAMMDMTVKDQLRKGYGDQHSTDRKYLLDHGVRYTQLMVMLQVSFILDDIANVVSIVGLVRMADRVMKTVR